MSVEVLKNVYFICLSGKRKNCLYKNNEVFMVCNEGSVFMI